MKLANSGNSIELYTNDLIIAGSRYTRDFKEYPLNSVATTADFTGLYAVNSKTIRFTTAVAPVTSRLKKQSAIEKDGEIIRFKNADPGNINYVGTTVGMKYSEDFSSVTPLPTNGQVVHTQFEYTPNFLYGTINNSNNLKEYGSRTGLTIKNFKDLGTSNTQTAMRIIGASTQYSINNIVNTRVIKTTSEKDVIAIDFDRGCGASQGSGSFASTISNVTEASLGMQSSTKGNNFAIFSINSADMATSSFTGATFAKTVLGADWTTEVVSGATAVYFDTMPSNAIDNTDGTMTMYLTRPYVSTQQKLGIWKIVINLENKTYTTQDLTLDEVIPYEVVTMSSNTDNIKLYRAYATEYYRDENDRCFVTVICKAINNNPTFVKVMCYEVDETNNTATLLGTYTPADGNLQEYDMINSKTMLIGSPLLYKILTLDKDNGWIQTVSKDIAIDEITYDATANALFYTDTSKNIYMDKLDLAMSADWGWSEEGLEWLGEPIHTSLYMSCKDFTGNLVAQSVKLYIDGNAVFDSTSTKEAEVLTTTTGPITIPVTITGEGTITVSAKALVQ